MLVASSLYEAARYYELFQKTVFKGKCAVVTSYNPMAKDVTLEDTGANTETDKQFLYNLYTALLKDATPKPGKTIRGRGKRIIQIAADQHEIAGGRGQIAHRLRRTVLHVSLH